MSDDQKQVEKTTVSVKIPVISEDLKAVISKRRGTDNEHLFWCEPKEQRRHYRSCCHLVDGFKNNGMKDSEGEGEGNCFYYMAKQRCTAVNMIDEEDKKVENIYYTERYGGTVDQPMSDPSLSKSRPTLKYKTVKVPKEKSCNSSNDDVKSITQSQYNLALARINGLEDEEKAKKLRAEIGKLKIVG